MNNAPLTILTQTDVERLMAEPSPVVRAELAGKLAHQIDNPRLSDSELNLAQDIVRLMARDVEASVRQALAQSLRQAARLPHDVAIKLAQDVESVALPILEHSKVLTEEDLIAVVSGGAAAKQEIIAARADVSENVAAAIVATGGEKAVTTLMSNASAKINEQSLSQAIDRFAESDAVKETMAKRPTLPAAVTERLVTMVAENLKDYLVSHHELSPGMATDIVLQSRERTVVSLTGQSNAQELERMVTQMHLSKRLTASLVLRALCMGDVAFFETALAVMANVPVTNARVLIHDAGQLGLKSLYEKTGLPVQLLPAVRIAVDVVHETEMDGDDKGRERYRSRVLERILTQYEDFGAEDLNYLLDKLGSI